MGIPDGTAIQDSPSLTPLGDACSRQDLTAIHEMLEDIGYKDDEWIANEVNYVPFFLFKFYLFGKYLGNKPKESMFV